jgi:tetratricopeptide (TPR) repeat protein
VDEIIVVDTGSTDATPAVAQRYGAKIFNHPWENDFSKHRNQSISHATGQWILILDADEELDQETAPRMREIVAKLPPHIGCVHFELYNDLPSGQRTMVNHPRLFRNDGYFHYEGPVHNTPIYRGKTASSDIRLFHYGYNLDVKSMEEKQKRRESMLSAWLNSEPDSYAAHAYMAQTLLAKPESREQSAEHALQALRLAKKESRNPVDYPRAYYPLLAALCHLGREEEANRYAQECIDIIPTYPDPYYFLTVNHFKQKKLEHTCRAARQFIAAQDEARAHPERFRYMENMTVNHLGEALYRWSAAAAMLGRREEAQETFKRMLEESNAEFNARSLIQSLLSPAEAPLALDLSQLALDSPHQWKWAGLYHQLAKGKAQEPEARQFKQAGLTKQSQGDHAGAEAELKRAVEISPSDAEALLALGRSCCETGRPAEAEAWLTKGLNADPGHPAFWKLLADILFGRGDYRGAAAVFRRYLAMDPAGEKAVKARLEVCERRLAQGPAEPTVAKKPPVLAVFLVGGLTPEMARLGGAYFSLHRAWGEFLEPAPGETAPDLPGWASLFTGAGPDVHGIKSEQSRQTPLSFKDLKVISLWEIIGRHFSVGLLAAPLAGPAPEIPGWAAAGYPAGLLEPALTRPASLSPLLLAEGFRPDFLLNDFDDHTYTYTLSHSRAKEALLSQIERTKLAAALSLPAVDVLVIGLNFLEHMQAVFPQNEDRVFSAYQQVYGWLETALAALRPQTFAVLSQRGYDRQSKTPRGGGFYCLSWLRGENLKARLTDVAPEILKFLKINPGELGRPRKG